MTTFAATLEAPYKPRHVRFVRREDMADWRLKLYGIAVNGEDLRPEFMAAAARQTWPRPFSRNRPSPTTKHSVGFVTAHDARRLGIALVYWWQSENELHQRIYVSPKDDPTAFTWVENQPAGCVWELAVVDSSAGRGSRTCSPTPTARISSATSSAASTGTCSA